MEESCGIDGDERLLQIWQCYCQEEIPGNHGPSQASEEFLVDSAGGECMIPRMSTFVRTNRFGSKGVQSNMRGIQARGFQREL